MNEADLNEGVSQILDSEKTALHTQKGVLSLRDILTTVYETQESNTRWWHKLFGKPKVSVESIILHLPGRLGQYINLSEGGLYLGFKTQLEAELELMVHIGVLDSIRAFELNEVDDIIEEQSLYGVSSYGKAFVEYEETKTN